MAQERKMTIRLTDVLRQVLEREAAEAGVTLSEQARRRLLATYPYVAAYEDVARIKASARKSGATGAEGLPYLQNMLRRLEEGRQALREFEALTARWRDAAAQEFDVAIDDLTEQIRVLAGLDAIATTMRKGLE
jgi:hypothetical protein